MIIINVANPFGSRKFPITLYTFYKAMKLIKNYDPRIEIFLEVLEGTTVELDILVKIIYYLSS